MPKASKEFLEGLNEGLSEELGSIIQYLWQHVMARGKDSPAIANLFKEISMVEMNHAYKLAERIDLLGGVPTTAIGPIKVGGSLEKMLQDDLDAEYAAIDLYKRLLKQAGKENDPITERLLEEILGETEDHADKLEAILAKK